MIKGHNLRIEREPEAGEIIREIGDPRRYREIVFCGYGEPTIRLETMKEVAAWVKDFWIRLAISMMILLVSGMSI